MNREVIAKNDIMTVGEGPGITLANGLNYVNEDRKELNMIFHFDHMFLDHGPNGKFDPVTYDFVAFKKIFSDWDKALGDKGWNSIFLGNHDFPRMLSRFGNDAEFHEESGKLFALMLLTMRGTPYIYQGDEIGMTNVAFPNFEDYRDVETLNLTKTRNSEELAEILPAVHWQGRDNARTPMQCSGEYNAGFSSGLPWIKVNENHGQLNVEMQEKNPRSILHFYRKMITIRKTYPALVYGTFECITPEDQNLFVYTRKDEEYELMVVLNFSSENQKYKMPTAFDGAVFIKIVCNYRISEEVKEGAIDLKPWEAILLKIKRN